MIFEITVTNGEREWVEEYDKDVADPNEWAERTIKWFNNTLRRGEKPRKLLGVRIINDGKTRPNHTWRKVSLVTESGPLPYDRYQCEVCGITGKRYGLNDNISLDSKYAKAKVYQRCDTALAHIQKLRKR